MSAPRAPEPSSPAAELWRRRGRLLRLGGMLAVLGVGVGLAAAAASRFTVDALGMVLVMGGVAQSLHALRFWRSHWAAFTPALLAGVLYLVCGVLLAAGPAVPPAGVTLLMATVLIASGAMRVLWSFGSTMPGRGASLARGGAALLLGVALCAVWPATSLWAVGVFVGADLLADGAMLVFLAWRARRLAPRGA